MKRGFKLVLKNDPNTVYETDRREFVLGRSKECEIVIKDPHISRVQARIRFEDSRYYIENLGQNPIHVNDLPTTGQFLNEGDEIKVDAIVKKVGLPCFVKPNNAGVSQGFNDQSIIFIGIRNLFG